MELLRYLHPILRQKAAPVTVETPSLSELLGEVQYQLRWGRLFGIAAPQLGVSQRVIGVNLPRGEYGRNRYVLLNPTIVERYGWQWNIETCLSLPGKCNLVPRYERVTVQAMLPDGKEIILEERKFRAAILQHEMNHLEGILIKDYHLLSRTPRPKPGRD